MAEYLPVSPRRRDRHGGECGRHDDGADYNSLHGQDGPLALADVAWCFPRCFGAVRMAGCAGVGTRHDQQPFGGSLAL